MLLCHCRSVCFVETLELYLYPRDTLWVFINYNSPMKLPGKPSNQTKLRFDAT